MEQEFLVVGQVVAAQGLKGEVRILPASDFPERFTKPGARWLRRRGQAEKEVKLLSGRQLPGKQLFVVRFEGINDRTAAERLVHQEFAVAADDRPELEDGEFHLLDLQGLNVQLHKEAEPIGVVVDLHHAGNDLLEIELISCGKKCLIPLVKEIVTEINDHYIIINPPKGLLELGA